MSELRAVWDTDEFRQRTIAMQKYLSKLESFDLEKEFTETIKSGDIYMNNLVSLELHNRRYTLKKMAMMRKSAKTPNFGVS